MTTASIALEDPPVAAAADVRDAPPGQSSPPETYQATEIAELLVQEGHLTAGQLQYALRVRAKLAKTQPLLTVLQELNFVSAEQIKATLPKYNISIRLGTLLVELGMIGEADLQAALAIKSGEEKRKLGEILVENHFISEHELLDVLSLQLGFPYLDQERLEIDVEMASRVKPGWFEQQQCVPAKDADGQSLLVFVNPLDSPPLSGLQRIFGQEITLGIARQYVIAAAIGKLTGAGKTGAARGDIENAVVKTVNELIETAANTNTSDIHIEPTKDRLRIRMRQDGVLTHFKDFPLDLAAPLSSRIKIMANADIAERRRHQDGRMLFECDGIKLDMRVSFYATIYGEKIVMRLLNNRSELLDIKDIGMAPRMFQRFRDDVLDIPSGVVIITGPTGSGKTTTLYGAVNYLNNPNTSIITAEDPVEYVIDGISQCSINSKINITYEETLRHIVRQDPDVIVIGEIRDRFSAETAVQAALTGHKVLTTFHTEDSIGGLLRLLHMDIEAFLISSTVVCVVAQRLLRRVCPHCRQDHVLTPDETRRLGYNPAEVTRLIFGRGTGCAQCHYMGYRGRLAIFEMLVLNEQVKNALIHRKTSYEIRQISAETTGLITLLESGIIRAAQGMTSFEELIHRLPRLGKPRPLQELFRMQGVTL
jgi:type IV pilus assembly protein PilB